MTTVATPTAAPTTPGTDVEVDGVRCGRGHFNAGSAGWCGICGMSMLLAQPGAATGRPTTVGVLIDDQGSAHPIDGPQFVVRCLPGAEPERLAEITVHDWAVRVTDLGSSLGTSVSDPGGLPRRLIPHQVVEISPGTRICAGGTTLVFHSTINRFPAFHANAR